MKIFKILKNFWAVVTPNHISFHKTKLLNVLKIELWDVVAFYYDFWMWHKKFFAQKIFLKTAIFEVVIQYRKSDFILDDFSAQKSCSEMEFGLPALFLMRNTISELAKQPMLLWIGYAYMDVNNCQGSLLTNDFHLSGRLNETDVIRMHYLPIEPVLRQCCLFKSIKLA